MSDFAAKGSSVQGRAPAHAVERHACVVQVFDRAGKALAPPATTPPWCAVVAATRPGATVCNRGCGFSLPRNHPSGSCRAFRCPFGVSNLAMRLAGGPDGVVHVVGGRYFESYGQFRSFVERAIDAGAPLATLLEACPALDFRSELAERRRFGEAIAHLLPGLGQDPGDLEQGEDALLRPDYPRLDAMAMPGHPEWAELRRAQESLERAGEPQTLRRMLVEELSDLSRSRKASLFLADPSARDLVLVHAIGLPPLVRPGLRRPIDQGVMGQVFASREPLVVESLDARPDLRPSAHGHYRSASFACLPLVSGDDRLGVLNLTDRREGLRFTREDIEWLRTAAQVGAGAARRLALARRLQRVQRETPSGPPGQADQIPSALFLDARLEIEFQRARRYRRALSLILLQVDMSLWPGRNADRRVPDLIRRGVASVLGPSLRAFDQVMHYAGASHLLGPMPVFGIVLPETRSADARSVAERLQAAVHERFLAHLPRQHDAQSALATAAGVAAYPDDATGLEELRCAAEADLLRTEQPQASAQPHRTDGLPDLECLPAEPDEEREGAP